MEVALKQNRIDNTPNKEFKGKLKKGSFGYPFLYVDYVVKIQPIPFFNGFWNFK
jgi:hypothetical protein